MLAHIQAAIIDLDGTLLDTSTEIQRAINLMRAEFDLPPLELATTTQYIGKGTEHLIHAVLTLDFGESAAEHYFAQAMSSYQHHYAQINGDLAVTYPEVHEGLRAMKALGLRLACVTNKPIALALPLLQKKDLRDYFDVVYGGDSLPKKKPDPLPLLQVCADFNLKPQQVVAIGDSSNDAQAARAAGCHVLNVPYGYNHGQPIQDVDSDGIVSSLLDAAHLIST